ncbi:MAG: FkbM family methyltransferase [bacterium]
MNHVIRSPYKQLKKTFNRLLRVFARTFAKRLSKVYSSSCFERLLYERLAITDDFFFIQIGANDGKSFDPIYHFVMSEKVGGLVIEPVRYFYDQLQHNYRNNQKVTPVNVAIHNTEESMSVFTVDPEKLDSLPDHAKGIASFNRAHHQLSGTPSDCVIEQKVRCVSLSKLVDEYHVEKVDLLQIDTEGYDAEILLNMNFNHVKPSIIRFEHGLYAGIMIAETFRRVVNRLHENGYELIIEPEDATAYRLDAFLDI